MIQPGRFCRGFSTALLMIVPVASAPVSAAAQGQPETLRLMDALDLARAGNPDLRKADLETERAAAHRRASWGAFLPQLSAGASLADVSSRTVTARNEFGQPVALDDPAAFSSTSAVGSLGASLTVFDGLRRVNELQAARAQSRGTAALVNAEWVRLGAEVRRRFYSSLAAEQLVAVEERLLAAARERLQATEAMAHAGRATPQDVLGAEVELARQEMSVEGARGNAFTAKLALAELLGLPGEPTFAIAGELPAADLPAEIAADAFVAAALDASPRILRIEAIADRADHLADAARGIAWPALRLSAGYSREVSLADPAQLTSFPWNRGLSLGLSASVPLFTGFSASAQIADARVAREGAAEDVRKTRLAIEREVRTAITDVELAYRSVSLAERAAELSRRRLETGQDGFRLGLIGFTELQQLIEQAAQSERTAVRSRLEYGTARATLDEAVGLPVTGNQAADQ